MTTHPPIPPNCEYFYPLPGGPCVFESHKADECRETHRYHSRIVQYLDNVPPKIRPLIAAVARCAWLDAAANALAHRAVSQDAFGVHATVRPSQDWLEAMMQAEAWRAWGESKD